MTQLTMNNWVFAYGFLPPIPPIYFHFMISQKIVYFFTPTVGWEVRIQHGVDFFCGPSKFHE